MTTDDLDATPILRGMYAAEQEYLDAGGPGVAPFSALATFFASDVVLHQPIRCRTAASGAATTGWSDSSSP